MTPYIVGNWKMNTTAAEARALAEALASAAASHGEVDLGIAPPAVYLPIVLEAVGGARLAVGGQNCHDAPSGAFTGEVSAPMLKDVGARFVILGHSERRHVFGESGATIRKKVEAALEAGLEVIYCVGETLDERDSNRAEVVVRDQVKQGLEGLDLSAVTVAYEPVWAIGTGRTATPEQAGAMHGVIRELVRDIFGEDEARRLRILYGGSVKPDNARELLSTEGIDGALVGGASLKAESFLAIAESHQS